MNTSTGPAQTPDDNNDQTPDRAATPTGRQEVLERLSVWVGDSLPPEVAGQLTECGLNIATGDLMAALVCAGTALTMLSAGH